jgi:hypothetical protein
MPSRLFLAPSLLLVMALFTGTDRGLTQEVTPGTPTPTVQASLRRSSDHLPAGCALDETVQFLTDFLDAFNRGDVAALPRFFPTEGVYPYADQRGFQWYSVTDQNGHFVTYDPANLPAYLVDRHEQHERLQLLELEVAASWHPGVDIVFRLSRKADDLPSHEANGKGAIYCDDHTIFVWSMAQDVPDPALLATPYSRLVGAVIG